MIRARLTIDSSDLGDVIRRSGAGYMAGPDLRSRFGEPGAPETLDELGHQEMNPLSGCPLLREAGKDSTIPKPPRYDERSFDNWKNAPPPRLPRSLPDAARFSDVPLGHPDREAIETMLLWGNFGGQKDTFHPAGQVRWGDLNRWLVALGDPGFPTLLGKAEGGVLTRAECVEYLWRVWTR